MKLSEKITELRKINGMTQEELAAICSVSRQSISKWEADITLPETEKLLLLGKTFQVSMDVLLRDELTLGEAKEVYTCGNNAVQEKKQELFEGILIKESVAVDATLVSFMFIKSNCGTPAENPNIGLRCFLQALPLIFRSWFPKLCCPIPAAEAGLLILRQAR